MAGRQLPFVSLLVPAWLVVTMSGWSGLRGVWPAVLVCGGSFAVVQFAWSNLIGPELVDIAGGLVSIGALALFVRVWKPRDVWEFPEERAEREGDRATRLRSGVDEDPALTASTERTGIDQRAVWRAWVPWLFLSVAVASKTRAR
jgi:lactate permease